MATKKTTKKPAPHKDSTSTHAAPVHEDPSAPQKAFDALLDELKAIPGNAVNPVNTDLQEASIRGLGVADFLDEPEPRERFGYLHPKLFNPVHVTRLRPLALAAGHAYVELQSARAQSSEALLPAPLVAAATEVKARMIGRVKYVFQLHPTLSLEVQDIISGTGYRDLESDLVRLANLYRDHPDDVAGDKLFYRPTDEVDARRLAARIKKELGKSQSAAEARWVDLSARVWTLYRSCYAEIYAAGHFVYRGEDPESKFPTLHIVGASSRKSSSDASAAPEAPKTEEPSPPADATEPKKG